MRVAETAKNNVEIPIIQPNRQTNAYSRFKEQLELLSRLRDDIVLKKNVSIDERYILLQKISDMMDAVENEARKCNRLFTRSSEPERKVPVLINAMYAGGRHMITPMVETILKTKGYGCYEYNAAVFGNELPNRVLLHQHIYAHTEKQWAHIIDEPKYLHYKMIYCMRDPRDALVSAMNFLRNAEACSNLPDRKLLNSMAEDETLIYLMDHSVSGSQWHGLEHLCTDAVFFSQHPSVFCVTYEELKHAPHINLKRILMFLGYTPSLCEIQEGVDAGLFKHWSGGRKEGIEDKTSYIRKGIVGDWHNYFTEEVQERFSEIAKDTLQMLNYEDT